MSNTYSAADDKGALLERAAELGRRRHAESPRQLHASDVSAVAARRRLSRCYAALAAVPRAPDWAQIKRLARFAETAAAAARASEHGERPASLRKEAAFVKSHVVLCEASQRCGTLPRRASRDGLRRGTAFASRTLEPNRRRPSTAATWARAWRPSAAARRRAPHYWRTSGPARARRRLEAVSRGIVSRPYLHRFFSKLDEATAEGRLWTREKKCWQ